MEILIGEDILYPLLFADDQVVIEVHIDGSSYMLQKLREEYEKWGLTVNLGKTK